MGRSGCTDAICCDDRIAMNKASRRRKRWRICRRCPMRRSWLYERCCPESSLVDPAETFEIERALSHGGVAAVHAMAVKLDVKKLLAQTVVSGTWPTPGDLAGAAPEIEAADPGMVERHHTGHGPGRCRRQQRRPANTRGSDRRTCCGRRTEFAPSATRRVPRRWNPRPGPIRRWSHEPETVEGPPPSCPGLRPTPSRPVRSRSGSAWFRAVRIGSRD
jgi:hypothetical protein